MTEEDRGQHCYTSWCECLSSGERLCLLCRQGRCPVEQETGSPEAEANHDRG